jgi:hypothetical protein
VSAAIYLTFNKSYLDDLKFIEILKLAPIYPGSKHGFVCTSTDRVGNAARINLSTLGYDTTSNTNDIQPQIMKQSNQVLRNAQFLDQHAILVQCKEVGAIVSDCVSLFQGSTQTC